jgi:hypothetical protein
MVIGLKEAIEELLERQRMNKSQVFKTTNFFMGVLEDMERQWPDKNKAIEFAEWIRKEKYFYDNDRCKYVAAWNNYTAYTITDLYKEFLQSLKQ